MITHTDIEESLFSLAGPYFWYTLRGGGAGDHTQNLVRIGKPIPVFLNMPE